MGKVMRIEDVEKIANDVIEVLIENGVTIEFIDNIFDFAKDKSYESPIKKKEVRSMINGQIGEKGTQGPTDIEATRDMIIMFKYKLAHELYEKIMIKMSKENMSEKEYEVFMSQIDAFIKLTNGI